MSKLKEMREARGMSQEELSEKSGVSRTIISKLENDSNVVTTTKTLLALATTLDCQVTDIFYAQNV